MVPFLIEGGVVIEPGDGQKTVPEPNCASQRSVAHSFCLCGRLDPVAQPTEQGGRFPERVVADAEAAKVDLGDDFLGAHHEGRLRGGVDGEPGRAVVIDQSAVELLVLEACRNAFEAEHAHAPVGGEDDDAR